MWRTSGHGFKEYPVVLQKHLLARRKVIPEPRSAFQVTWRRQMLLQSIKKNPSHGAILALALVKRKHQLGAEAGFVVLKQEGPAVQFHHAGDKAEA